MSNVFRCLMIGFCVAALLGCNAAQQGSAGSDLPDVVASIDGVNITKQELSALTEGQLTRLQAQMYQIHKVALDGLIGEKLVAKAAKDAGKSVEDFMKDEVESKLTPPSDDVLKNFFEQNKAQLGGKTFAETKERIRGYMQSSQRRQVEQQLAKRLKDGATIVTFIEPPRTKVDATGPGWGPENAKVTIVEFSDFQCPFCGRARDTVQQIRDVYGDKVRYVFRDFPLNFHKEAFKAHEAAHCAGEQDKYWEMNTILFTKQRQLGVPQLKNYAADLTLDAKAFNECLDTSKYAKLVQDNIEAGASVGVTGTPAFFVNGIPLSGARPFADFKRIIDEELQGS